MSGEAGEFLLQPIAAARWAGDRCARLRRADDLLKIRAALVADELAYRHLETPPGEERRL